MKFAIISDTHLGFGAGERKMDAVLAFEEAVNKSMEMADAILFAGDMFDSPFPRSEAIFHAIRILSKLKSGKDVEFSMERDVGELNRKGMPFIAITGNHERRSREFRDPLQRLEDAGLLIRLHGEGIDFGDSYVYGVSSVPERFAARVFEKLSPKPKDSRYNIFMFHQSIEGFVYSPTDKPSLTLSHLPKGFQLYIDGHIHARQVLEMESGKLLICGSTILTQLKNEGRKGFHIIDTSGKIEFHELEMQRDVLFVDVDREGLEKSLQRIEEFLSMERKMKPIIRITGTGISRRDFMRFEDKALMSFKIQSKSRETRKVETEEEKEDELFHMLAEGNLEDVMKRLENDYKNKAKELQVP